MADMTVDEGHLNIHCGGFCQVKSYRPRVAEPQSSQSSLWVSEVTVFNESHQDVRKGFAIGDRPPNAVGSPGVRTSLAYGYLVENSLSMFINIETVGQCSFFPSPTHLKWNHFMPLWCEWDRMFVAQVLTSAQVTCVGLGEKD